MTLDETIMFIRDVAERNKRIIDFDPEDSVDNDIKMNCINCAEQHEQLAVWLEDLKRRIEYDKELMGSGALNNAYKSGYKKAIDDFVERSRLDYLDSLYYEVHMFRILKVAERLKAGALDG